MKQHWGTDELVEHWTLLPRETELLTNKTGATRLGFAVLLKFFQLEAYFPQHGSAVPTVAVEFIAKQDHMRDAIRRVVNAIFCVRHPHIWGEGTTACASDSKKFGAWDQNLMTDAQQPIDSTSPASSRATTVNDLAADPSAYL